jgi:hypothetical protein
LGSASALSLFYQVIRLLRRCPVVSQHDPLPVVIVMTMSRRVTHMFDLV